MRVMLTGGSGFLGRFTIPHLVGLGIEVVALARSAPAAAAVERLGAAAVRGDLDDPASIRDAFASSGADRLVNLASLGFGHAPGIVEAASSAGLRRSLFVSTTAIFTKLPAPTKRIRVAAEETIRLSTLDWTIVRPTMIYGAPGDRNMERLLRRVRAVPMVPAPGGGRQLQQPIHVDDLAAAIVRFTTNPSATHQAYDLAGPDALSFRTIVEEAGAAVGRSARIVPLPLGLAVAALRTYERISRNPRLKAEQLERLAEDKVFDIRPAQQLIDFSPRAFALGIREEAVALGLAPAER